MRKIIIENLKKGPIEKATVQMAERKGLGHPDTLMDGVCNAASNTLSEYYLKNFKAVLHHNVDKGLLVAGVSRPKFCGGKVIAQIKIYICGRATSQVGGRKINVKKIVEKAAVDYLKQIRYLKREHYKIYTEIKEGAANLKEVFKRGVPIANDTSFGVAHAPLSSVEQLALDVANFLNYKLKKRYKAIGDDIKVMACKYENKLRLTVAIAFVDKFICSMDDYVDIKEKVISEIKKFVKVPCSVELNTLDWVKGNESTVYLTVTGLSAEQGDDGQVGRGNRPSGLITPNRPMSLEATAGKNINHPGKLYQVLAQIMANRISKLEGVKECYVKVLTQIGKPLDTPLVSVELLGGNFKRNLIKSKRIINGVLDNLRKVQKSIVKGEYKLF